MSLPAEDAYWQIGDDTSRLWSTAQRAYVAPDDVGFTAWLPTSAWQGPIPALSEEALSATLTNLGLGPLAPIPQAPPRDPLAEIDAIKADLADLAASAALEGSP